MAIGEGIHGQLIDYQMRHLNHNVLCAIDIEVTGDNPRESDIVEIGVIVLDNFIKPSNNIVPFNIEMRPARPENIDFEEMTVKKQRLAEIQMNGMSAVDAADRFEEWWTLLNIKYNKGIAPLCHNWPRLREHLINWLGWHNFNHLFQQLQYRDLLGMALQVNDRYNMKLEETPFPKTDIAYLGNLTKIEVSKSMDVLGRCMAIAEIYKRMLTLVRF